MTRAAVIEITSLGRPPTTNRLLNGGQRRWSHHGRPAWRDAAHAAAIEAGDVDLPSSPCGIEITVLHAGGPQQDIGSCAPAAKAAIDGLIRAGWLVDDDPAHVARVTYLPHQPTAEHGLRIALVTP